MTDYYSYRPLGIPNYSRIPHLPTSRMGRGKHHLDWGQVRIATENSRDYKDLVIVQEKLDGANVGIAKKEGELICLSKSGHDCSISPHPLHHYFVKFVKYHEKRFKDLLKEGERICGEWMLIAHGTKYSLPHEPFVAFDYFTPENERLTYHNFLLKVLPFGFIIPRLLHLGQAINDKKILKILDADSSYHGALEDIEGMIWRVERNGKVDFLCKYVREGKKDGKYLDDNNLLFNELKPEFEFLKSL